MFQNILISIFKFYRLHFKVILGSLVGLVCLLLIVGGVSIFNRLQRTQTAGNTAVGQVGDASITSSPPASATLSAIPLVSPSPSSTVAILKLAPSASPSAKKVEISSSSAKTVQASPSAKPSPVAVVKPSITPILPSPTLKPITKDNRVITEQKVVQLNDDKYVVQKGDTLWDISQRTLGDGKRYLEIAKVNTLLSPNHIEVGQELKIVVTAEATSDSKEKLSESGVTIHNKQTVPKAAIGGQYVVKSGDTLWDIATQQLSDPYKWVELYELNKDTIGSNPHLIYPQTSLRLPGSSVIK